MWYCVLNLLLHLIVWYGSNRCVMISMLCLYTFYILTSALQLNKFIIHFKFPISKQTIYNSQNIYPNRINRQHTWYEKEFWFFKIVFCLCHLKQCFKHSRGNARSVDNVHVRSKTFQLHRYAKAWIVLFWPIMHLVTFP